MTSAVSSYTQNKLERMGTVVPKSNMMLRNSKDNQSMMIKSQANVSRFAPSNVSSGKMPAGATKFLDK